MSRSKTKRHDPLVHGRVIAARQGMLSHAEHSCEFLRQAEQRLSYCLLKVTEWQGFLNEVNYSRERDKADEAGDKRKFDELKKVQRARRLAYFGWKLAALGALGQVYRRFSEYAKDVRGLATQMPDQLNTYIREGAPVQWLLSPGSGGSARVTGKFAGGEQFSLLRDDASNGMGLEELERAYNAFIELNVVGKDDGELKYGDEHVWEGKYEPFYFGSLEPFTLVWLIGSSDHFLLGNHLWHKYRDLLGDRADTNNPPLYLLQQTEQAYVAVNEPQYEQRRKSITGSIKGGQVIPPSLDLDEDYKRVLLTAVDLDQGYKRCNFLRLFNETVEWIGKVEEFKGDLDEFIDNHRNHHCRLSELPSDFERMVARYNLLSAVAMSRSIARLLKVWQTFQERFDALACKLKGQVAEYTESHVKDVYSQLGAMQHALGTASGDPAATAAHSWLSGELERSDSDQ